MLVQASWMLHFTCISLIRSWEMLRFVMHCHGWLFHCFQSRCTRPHHIPDVPIIFSPVNRISPNCAENPKKGPKIFTESNIKITGTQNIGARHIFMPNHSQVRRVAGNGHAELCTLYPLASTKAAWQLFFSAPQEYQSELL